MTSLTTVIAVATAYVGLLFLVAVWGERQERRGRRVVSNALVYSLSLAVYHTTWTYYGSVGLAASSGLLFLGVYIGPTLAVIFWWQLLRKMVRIKNAHRVTSVVDLLSLRYGRSQSVAVLATIALLLGLVPYISLQLKTMIAAVALLTGHQGAAAYPMGTHVGLPIVLLMIVFTIVFGIRRLSPTERHPGMMGALAAEGVVKLVGVTAAGAFVTYGLFHGFGDVFRRAAQAGIQPALLGRGGSVATWLSYVLTSTAAILFLPRQFHVAVVENSDEDHIRTAMWLFPLYMLAINVFVLPLALGGLLLGHPASAADSFVLSLPHAAGARWLSWLVFLGGFSAGTGMVMAETMTLATMVSNHLFLPAMGLWRPLGRLRRHLLAARWLAAALLILVSFAYERTFGSHYDLVSIGLISFAAILVLAPVLAGGLYWRGASTSGALAGLAAGFAAWSYTLIVPVFVRAGWLPQRLLIEGLAGISALRPEALFGLGWLDRISHAVFWILFFNVSAFVLGSLLFPASADEEARVERLAEPIVRPAPERTEAGERALADAGEKRGRVVRLLAQYCRPQEAERLADACLRKVGPAAKGQLSALQLASLEAEVETTLASFIGTAAAYAALKRQRLATPVEARAISSAYAEILAALQVPPAELQRKINYHREREHRTTAYQAELLRNLHDAVIGLDAEQVIRSWNPAAERIFGWKAEEVIGRRIRDALPSEYSGRSSYEDFLSGLNREGRIQFDVRRRVRDGSWVDIEAAAAVLRDEDGRLTGYVSVNRDVTERKRTEAQLIFAERMASVGTLAAGVAHEINNPLAFIVANLAFAVRELTGRPSDDRGEVVVALEEASEGAVRVREIVQALKSFSRHDVTADEPIDVVKVLRSSIRLAQNEIQHRARMVTEFSAVPFVRGSEQRLGQVFLNLLINAAQAISQGNADRNEIRAVTRLDDTGRVVVEIHDTGSGIAPGVMGRIFDPFFTTKPPGVGTGLGLSICHGIVTSLGGEIGVESRLEGGSTFRVVLPVAYEDSCNARNRCERPGAASVSQATRGRILVVDDEPLVGRSIGRVLSPPHEVVTVTSAREALLGLEGVPPFDLVLCDLMMPEMSGMDFYSALMDRAPKAAARMVFLTGGAFTPQARRFLEQVPNFRIDKPFDPAVLRELVDRLLSEVPIISGADG